MSDNSRFVDYTFGTVTSDIVTVNNSLNIAGIVTSTPVEGGSLHLPNNATVVYINSTIGYFQLTFIMPLKPIHGQLLIITSNVSVSSLVFNGNGTTFGMQMPNTLAANNPLRILYTSIEWIIV
jgi:hypothetical protein